LVYYCKGLIGVHNRFCVSYITSLWYIAIASAVYIAIASLCI